MRKQGNPASSQPNQSHHLQNVRLVGDEIVTRDGQLQGGTLSAPITGLHILVDDETEGGDVILGSTVMVCNQSFGTNGISTLGFEKSIQVVGLTTFDYPVVDLDGVGYSIKPVETGPGTSITTGISAATSIQKVDSFGVHGAPLCTIEIPVDASDKIRTQMFGTGLGKLWVVIGSPTDNAFTRVYSFSPTTGSLTLENSPVTLIDATFDFAFCFQHREDLFLMFRTATTAGSFVIRRRKWDGTWSTITNPAGWDFLAFPRPGVSYKDKGYLFQGKVESGTDLHINVWDPTAADFATVSNTIALGGTGAAINNVGGAAIGVHDSILYFLWAGFPLISVTLGTSYIGKFDGTTWTDSLGGVWGGSVGVVPNGILFSYAGRLWASIASIETVPGDFGGLVYSLAGTSWTHATPTPTTAFFRFALPKRT